MESKIISAILVLSITPLTCNANDLDLIDFKKQIQLRMDISNPSNNKAICLIYPQLNLSDKNRHSDFKIPYISLNYNQPTLMHKKPYGLFDEIISIEQKDNNYNVLYHYDISEYGKQFLTTWEKIDYFGFCFGKLSVESITNVKKDNELKITYQYKIENTPDWAYELVNSFFDQPLDQLQTSTAIFTYNTDNQLISLTDNYSYYFDMKLLIKE